MRAEIEDFKPAIAGGFCYVPIRAMEVAWTLCRQRPLGIADFRTWLAGFESAARLRMIRPQRTEPLPIPWESHLGGLLGITERRVRASVRRLVAAGLAGPEGPTAPTRPQGTDLLGETISSGKGSVAVPRRLLRYLVAGQPPSVIATAIASLLRGLSRRKGGWLGWGRFSASWVAKVFDLSLRQVREARARLVAVGFLTPIPSPQGIENRYGRGHALALDWVAPGHRARSRSARPEAEDCSRSAPPLNQDRFLKETRRDQEPLQRGQPGACAGEGGEGSKQPMIKPTDPFVRIPVAPIPTAPVPTPVAPIPVPAPTALPEPTLADVRAEDLADLDRLTSLQAQAAQAGLVGTSEADRLKFVALSEHCRRIGKNPPAMFVALLRRGAWSFIAQAEEEVARKRLIAHRQASAPKAIIPGRPTANPIVGAIVPLQGQPQAALPRRSTFVPDAKPGGPVGLGAILGRMGFVSG